MDRYVESGLSRSCFILFPLSVLLGILSDFRAVSWTAEETERSLTIRKRHSPERGPWGGRVFQRGVMRDITILFVMTPL